jgi:hypothetical protein
MVLVSAGDGDEYERYDNNGTLLFATTLKLSFILSSYHSHLS